MGIEASVIVCAHNEELYIEECLRSILKQTTRPSRIIVIADRCNDNTVAIARKVLPEGGGSVIVEKRKQSWKNSYAENLEQGRKEAIGDVLAVVDADMWVSPDFIERLSAQIEEYASVSAFVKTDPSQGWLNRLVSIWEKTYLFTPLGREPRGGARVISLEGLREVGGFRDVVAPDTDLDSRLRRRSYKVRMDRNVVALHRRRMNIRRSISYQMQAGRGRRELGVSAVRTLLHSLVRLRPFVVYGYFKEGEETRYPRR